jgi:hypothetical protein
VKWQDEANPQRKFQMVNRVFDEICLKIPKHEHEIEDLQLTKLERIVRMESHHRRASFLCRAYFESKHGYVNNKGLLRRRLKKVRKNTSHACSSPPTCAPCALWLHENW